MNETTPAGYIAKRRPPGTPTLDRQADRQADRQQTAKETEKGWQRGTRRTREGLHDSQVAEIPRKQEPSMVPNNAEGPNKTGITMSYRNGCSQGTVTSGKGSLGLWPQSLSTVMHPHSCTQILHPVPSLLPQGQWVLNIDTHLNSSFASRVRAVSVTNSRLALGHLGGQGRCGC